MASETVQTARRTSRVKRNTNRRLLELMLNEGLSPNDLARRALISGNSVRLAVDGFTPGPRIQKAIADALQVQPLVIWPWETQRR